MPSLCPSVCPSVCLSVTFVYSFTNKMMTTTTTTMMMMMMMMLILIVSKWLNISSNIFHNHVAALFQFFLTRPHREIPRGIFFTTHLFGVSAITTVVWSWKYRDLKIWVIGNSISKLAYDFLLVFHINHGYNNVSFPWYNAILLKNYQFFILHLL